MFHVKHFLFPDNLSEVHDGKREETDTEHYMEMFHVKHLTFPDILYEQ